MTEVHMDSNSNIVEFRRPQAPQPVSDSGDETTPRTANQPQLSHGKLAHANMDRTFMELEQVIAALVKESDGSSRTIPRFRQLLKDLRTQHAVLKP